MNTDRHPWYKEPWPWLLMAGPFVVVVAGVITAWLAIRSNDGLVADDYYKQGLAINQELHREQNAGKMGLTAEVMRSDRQLRVLISGVEQNRLPDQIRLRIAHPTRAGQDQNIVLRGEGGGVFAGALSTPIGGRWHIVVEDLAGQWRLQGDWQTDISESVRLGAEVPAQATGRQPAGR